MAPLPDLVQGTKLETTFHDDLTVHEHDTSDSDDHRRIECWETKQPPLGSGGFGDVYLQQCVEGRRRVEFRAVKMLSKHKAGSKKMDYVSELVAIAKFSQKKYAKYFVKLLGWYDTVDWLCIAMEYFPLGDLQRHMSEQPAMPESEVREISYQILKGLQYMHSENFAHRDIKPGNILIKSQPPQDSWRVKLSDFGISKRLDTTAAEQLSTIRGTSSYMAPELLGHVPGSGASIDHQAADMWSLGEMVFRMFTKVPAFPSAMSVMGYLARPDFFPYKALVDKGIGDDGQEFVKGLMRPAPGDRLKAGEALAHPWLGPVRPLPPRALSPLPLSGRSSPMPSAPPGVGFGSRPAARGWATGPSTLLTSQSSAETSLTIRASTARAHSAGPTIPESQSATPKTKTTDTGIRQATRKVTSVARGREEAASTTQTVAPSLQIPYKSQDPVEGRADSRTEQAGHERPTRVIYRGIEENEVGSLIVRAPDSPRDPRHDRTVRRPKTKEKACAVPEATEDDCSDGSTGAPLPRAKLEPRTKKSASAALQATEEDSTDGSTGHPLPCPKLEPRTKKSASAALEVTEEDSSEGSTFSPNPPAMRLKTSRGLLRRSRKLSPPGNPPDADELGGADSKRPSLFPAPPAARPDDSSPVEAPIRTSPVPATPVKKAATGNQGPGAASEEKEKGKSRESQRKPLSEDVKELRRKKAKLVLEFLTSDLVLDYQLPRKSVEETLDELESPVDDEHERDLGDIKRILMGLKDFHETAERISRDLSPPRVVVADELGLLAGNSGTKAPESFPKREMTLITPEHEWGPDDLVQWQDNTLVRGGKLGAQRPRAAKGGKRVKRVKRAELVARDRGFEPARVSSVLRLERRANRDPSPDPDDLQFNPFEYPKLSLAEYPMLNQAEYPELDLSEYPHISPVPRSGRRTGGSPLQDSDNSSFHLFEPRSAEAMSKARDPDSPAVGPVTNDGAGERPEVLSEDEDPYHGGERIWAKRHPYRPPREPATTVGGKETLRELFGIINEAVADFVFIQGADGPPSLAIAHRGDVAGKGAVTIHDVNTGRRTRTIELNSHVTHMAAAAPLLWRHTRVAVALASNYVEVWGVPEWKPQTMVQASNVVQLAFQPESDDRLIILFKDKVWSWTVDAHEKPFQEVHSATWTNRHVQFSADGLAFGVLADGPPSWPGPHPTAIRVFRWVDVQNSDGWVLEHVVKFRGPPIGCFSFNLERSSLVTLDAALLVREYLTQPHSGAVLELEGRLPYQKGRTVPVARADADLSPNGEILAFAGGSTGRLVIVRLNFLDSIRVLGEAVLGGVGVPGGVDRVKLSEDKRYVGVSGAGRTGMVVLETNWNPASATNFN